MDDNDIIMNFRTSIMKKITFFSIVLALFLTGCQEPQLIPPQFHFYEVHGYPELGIHQSTKKEIVSTEYDIYPSDSLITILIDAIGPSDNQPFGGHVTYTLTRHDGTSVNLNALNAITSENDEVQFRIIQQSGGIIQEQKAILSLRLDNCKPGDAFKLTVTYLWHRTVEKSLDIYVRSSQCGDRTYTEPRESATRA